MPAQAGGPAHRTEQLCSLAPNNPKSVQYQAAVREIVRGIGEVSGLSASEGEPGWVAVECPSAGMARWLAQAVKDEGVEARSTGKQVLVPVAEHFQVEAEVKSVITVVAKTTHYWHTHLPDDIKRYHTWEARFDQWGAWLRRKKP